MYAVLAITNYFNPPPPSAILWVPFLAELEAFKTGQICCFGKLEYVLNFLGKVFLKIFSMPNEHVNMASLSVLSYKYI